MHAQLPLVLIPAYRPDHRLMNVIDGLLTQADAFAGIIVVDDGSPDKTVFTEAKSRPGVTVLSHAKNQGKGAALKTGMRWVTENAPDSIGVVTADADGQHLPKDIVAVAKAFTQHPHALWLGSRNFKQKGVPFRSWLGNNFAHATFRIGLRIDIPDTQTGLRGVPRQLFDDLLASDSNRFEFELDMLIIAKRHELPFESIEITTVYEKGNKTSHFKPLTDSAIIYKKFLKFSGVGIASAALDYGLFALIYGFTGEILLAIALARLASGTFNFSMNRQWVFGKGGSLKRDATQYTLLAGVLVLLNYGLTKGLMWLTISPFIGKPAAEVIVFLLSYRLQKKLVFRSA